MCAGHDASDHGQEFSQAFWTVVEEDAEDMMKVEIDGKENTYDEDMNELELKLDKIFQNMKSKLMEIDPQINAGYIDRYNNTKSNAFLASVLNQFGTTYAGVATSHYGGRLPRGLQIPVQATAVGRRKYELEERVWHQKDATLYTAPQNL